MGRALHDRVENFEGARAWLRLPIASGIEIAARMEAMADRLDGWNLRFPTSQLT